MKRTMTGLILIALATPMPAQARDRDRSSGPYIITRDQALAIAYDHGMAYVSETDRDDGLWEIEGQNASGEKLEIEIDGQTGEVVKLETHGGAHHDGHGAHHSDDHD